MDFITEYLQNGAWFFVERDEDGLPNVDDLRTMCEYIDDDIAELECLKDTLDPEINDRETIKRFLIKQNLWTEDIKND